MSKCGGHPPSCPSPGLREEEIAVRTFSQFLCSMAVIKKTTTQSKSWSKEFGVMEGSQGRNLETQSETGQGGWCLSALAVLVNSLFYIIQDHPSRIVMPTVAWVLLPHQLLRTPRPTYLLTGNVLIVVADQNFMSPPWVRGR